MKFLCLLFLSLISIKTQVLIPTEIKDRKDIKQVKLTKIGDFGLVRKSRMGVPEHLHTGIDIQRPKKNYINEPIYPIAAGKVISIRNDGPYANIIVEHKTDNITFWSLYEHIAAISVKINESVSPTKPIARFMSKEELNKYGWQFDHFHLEILKLKPSQLRPTPEHPYRLYNSYSLVCFTQSDLNKYYYNPIDFLKSNL